MNAGIWKIATAKLCNQCIWDMEDEYIFAPRWRRTLGGKCERCGEQKKQTARLRYTMNKRGLEKRGLENGIEK